MTQIIQNKGNYFILFMVDEVVPKTNFVCLKSFSPATKRSNGVFRFNISYFMIGDRAILSDYLFDNIP